MPSWCTRRTRSMLPQYKLTTGVEMFGFPLDLVHLPSKTCIEFTSAGYKYSAPKTAYEVIRRIRLMHDGWAVLRFTPYQISHYGRACAAEISHTIEERTPLPTNAWISPENL